MIKSKKLICIVGSSGGGKDSFAQYLNEKYGIPSITSYTTRPMRDGEVYGREHYFVSKNEVPSNNEMIAYTVFGDYEYWATKASLHNLFEGSDLVIYIIDEDGVDYLKDIVCKDNSLGYFEIVPIYVSASKEVRLQRGVSPERIARDERRNKNNVKINYHYKVNNNYTKEDLFSQADSIIKNILK